MKVNPLTLRRISEAISQCSDRKLLRLLNRCYWREFFRLMAVVALCGVLSAQTLPDAPSHGHARRNFWLAHGGLLAATVFDEEVTHAGLGNHLCVEGTVNPPYPSRADLYRNGLAFDALVTGFDYLLYRTVGRGSQYAGAAVGIVKHVHGGVQWWTRGCFQ